MRIHTDVAIACATPRVLHCVPLLATYASLHTCNTQHLDNRALTYQVPQYSAFRGTEVVSCLLMSTGSACNECKAQM